MAAYGRHPQRTDRAGLRADVVWQRLGGRGQRSRAEQPHLAAPQRPGYQHRPGGLAHGAQPERQQQCLERHRGARRHHPQPGRVGPGRHSLPGAAGHRAGGAVAAVAGADPSQTQPGRGGHPASGCQCAGPGRWPDGRSDQQRALGSHGGRACHGGGGAVRRRRRGAGQGGRQHLHHGQPCHARLGGHARRGGESAGAGAGTRQPDRWCAAPLCDDAAHAPGRARWRPQRHARQFRQHRVARPQQSAGARRAAECEFRGHGPGGWHQPVECPGRGLGHGPVHRHGARQSIGAAQQHCGGAGGADAEHGAVDRTGASRRTDREPLHGSSGYRHSAGQCERSGRSQPGQLQREWGRVGHNDVDGVGHGLSRHPDHGARRCHRA